MTLAIPMGRSLPMVVILCSICACTAKTHSPPAAKRLPAALTLVSANATAKDALPYALAPNLYGMAGEAYLTRSPLGNESLSIGKEPGKICVKGTLAQVPVPADGSHPPYYQYWGVQFGLALNNGKAWMPGDIIGLSYVLEGPIVSPIRFKVLPFGLDPAIEASEKCRVMQPESGVTQNVLFADLTSYCWSPGNPALDLSKGLANFSVQIAANVRAPLPFDFCLKDVRPIFGPKKP